MVMNAENLMDDQDGGEWTARLRHRTVGRDRAARDRDFNLTGDQALAVGDNSFG